MTGRAGDIEKRYEAGGKDSKKWTTVKTTVVGREIENGFLEIGRKIILLKLIIFQYSVVFFLNQIFIDLLLSYSKFCIFDSNREIKIEFLSKKIKTKPVIISLFNQLMMLWLLSLLLALTREYLY